MPGVKLGSLPTGVIGNLAQLDFGTTERRKSYEGVKRVLRRKGFKKNMGAPYFSSGGPCLEPRNLGGLFKLLGNTLGYFPSGPKFRERHPLSAFPEWFAKPRNFHRVKRGNKALSGEVWRHSHGCGAKKACEQYISGPGEKTPSIERRRGGGNKTGLQEKGNNKGGAQY